MTPPAAQGQHSSHEWRFAGRPVMPDPVVCLEVGCERPYRIACGCGEVRWVQCATSDAEQCAPCGDRYRARVRHVARSGEVYGRQGVFLTLTAPSWVPHRIMFGRRVGPWCECTGGGCSDLAEWNATAGRRWNELITELRRLYGDLEYFRAAEVQRRGALHVHVLIRRRDGSPLAIRADKLRRLAVRLGWGHSIDIQPVVEAHWAYVAKYAAKASSDRIIVPWRGVRKRQRVDRETGEVTRVEVESAYPSYRTWTSSRRWGDTMASVKAAQRHYLLVLADLPDWRDEGLAYWWSELAPPRPRARRCGDPPAPAGQSGCLGSEVQG